jgi:hypothetical protein
MKLHPLPNRLRKLLKNSIYFINIWVFIDYWLTTTAVLHTGQVISFIRFIIKSYFDRFIMKYNILNDYFCVFQFSLKMHKFRKSKCLAKSVQKCKMRFFAFSNLAKFYQYKVFCWESWEIFSSFPGFSVSLSFDHSSSKHGAITVY